MLSLDVSQTDVGCTTSLTLVNKPVLHCVSRKCLLSVHCFTAFRTTVREASWQSSKIKTISHSPQTCLKRLPIVSAKISWIADLHLILTYVHSDFSGLSVLSPHLLPKQVHSGCTFQVTRQLYLLLFTSLDDWMLERELVRMFCESELSDKIALHASEKTDTKEKKGCNFSCFYC